MITRKDPKQSVLNFALGSAIVIQMAMTGSLNAQVDYSKDLVLHYTFDDKKEDKVANTLGDEHPGRKNKATLEKQSKSGNALRVRRNHDKFGYVEADDHEDFKSTNFTVAAWINLEQTNSNGSVVCKHDWFGGGSRGFVLRCYDGKRVNFTVGANGWLAAVGDTTLPAHRWVHVVGSFDGKKLSVYYNGRLDGTKMIEDPYTPSSYPFRIGHGAFALDTHRKFDGKIDDVMYWKRTLSAHEILAVYEDQKDARPAPLVAADIKELMVQLGSKQFAARKEAQSKLVEMGSEILPLLDSFRKKDDLEIQARIDQIRKAIKKNLWQ